MGWTSGPAVAGTEMRHRDLNAFDSGDIPGEQTFVDPGAARCPDEFGSGAVQEIVDMPVPWTCLITAKTAMPLDARCDSAPCAAYIEIDTRRQRISPEAAYFDPLRTFEPDYQDI